MQTATISFDRFNTLADGDAAERIRAARAKLGKDVVLLCHHYQRADVYAHADITGDSLKLSRLASQSDAENIVFCGVHFMAEVADILSRPDQVSILPDLAAGCSMADMASLAKVERAWRELSAVLDPDEKVTPVTYINSAADLKAFCGEHGGIVCTSSNATKILEWSFAQREKVLFFPDQHLGRWSGYKMGIPLDDMVIWNPDLEQGGLTREQIAKAKIILWHGYCSVHQMFQPQGHHQVPQPASRRLRHFAPRMQLRGLQAVRLHRQHRNHPADGQGGAAQYALAGRHRVEPGRASGAGGEARRQDRAVHGQHHLHVLDHAAHRSAASGMDAGKPGRRQGGEQDQRAGTRSEAGEDRPGAHARGVLTPASPSQKNCRQSGFACRMEPGQSCETGSPSRKTSGVIASTPPVLTGMACVNGNPCRWIQS